MAKPELGLKRVCVSCATKFYDLTRTPAVCPKCGAEQPPEQPRLRRAAGPVAVPEPKKRTPEAEGDEPELEVEEAEEAADDADDLEEDADVADDVEVEVDRDEET